MSAVGAINTRGLKTGISCTTVGGQTVHLYSADGNITFGGAGGANIPAIVADSRIMSPQALFDKHRAVIR